MTAVTIPKTIEEATERLDGVGALLTAKQWERAAIVYAFTREGEDGRPSNLVSSDQFPMSPNRFAALGIVGLRSHNTVNAYRRAWHDAILDGQATPVEPGEKVELPEREFPATMTGTAHSSPENVRAAIQRDPDVIRKAIGDDPVVLDRVAEQVAEHPVLARVVERKVEQRHQEAKVYPSEREPVPADAVRALLHAIDGFWDGSVVGLGTREEVLNLIAANRNSPSLLGVAGALPDQVADSLRQMAAKATEIADRIESQTALEVSR